MLVAITRNNLKYTMNTANWLYNLKYARSYLENNPLIQKFNFTLLLKLSAKNLAQIITIILLY